MHRTCYEEQAAPETVKQGTAAECVPSAPEPLAHWTGCEGWHLLSAFLAGRQQSNSCTLSECCLVGIGANGGDEDLLA